VAAEGVTFQTISAGFTHACAVSTTGAAYCWGSNAGGRLGTGASLTGGHTAPAPVAGGLSFRTISAGYYHTCGVTRSGATYCWGRNEQGETGDGATVAHGMPARVAGDFSARAVEAAGQFDYSCAIGRDSALYCWGANCYGQLGVDSTSEQCGTPAMPCSSTPKAVHASGPYLSISAFFSHVCAINAAGQASCWGDNNQGELGNGSGEFPDPDARPGGRDLQGHRDGPPVQLCGHRGRRRAVLGSERRRAARHRRQREPHGSDGGGRALSPDAPDDRRRGPPRRSPSASGAVARAERQN
jgi:alpha-tubulin suppressor-like RCC1 family protein